MRSIEAWLATLFLFFSGALGGQDQPAGVRKQKPFVPRDLEFASEIVDTLQTSGLEVFAVVPEKMPPFPGAENRVLLLTNEKKMIHVFFFPSEDAADHITITYSRSSQPGKHHRYSIEGWPAAAARFSTRFSPSISRCWAGGSSKRETRSSTASSRRRCARWAPPPSPPGNPAPSPTRASQARSPL
jgi:hypothetical protein